MRYRILCIILLISTTGYGRANLRLDTVYFSALKEKTSLFDLAHIKYIPTKPSAVYQQVKVLSFEKDLTDSIYKNDNAYWLKAIIFNDTDHNVRLYLYSGSVQLVNLYAQDVKGRLIWTAASGVYMPTPYLESRDQQDYVSLPLVKGQLVSVYIRLYNITNQNVDVNLMLEKPEYHFELMKQLGRWKLDGTYTGIIFCSSLTFLLLFMFFTFIKNKQRVYLFFCFYLLGAVIYACTQLNNTTLLGSWINYWPIFKILLNEPSQFLFFAAYNLFAIELLNMKQHDKILYQTLRLLSLVYVCYAFFHFIYIAVTYDAVMRDKLFLITRIFLFITNVFVIIRTFITLRKVRIYKYFITGVLIYFISGIIAAVTDHLYRTYGGNGSILMSGTIFKAGIMAETLCFAFAIGYRTKLIDDERKENQEKYILQLQINQALYEQANVELEEKVELRTNQILSYQNQIQEQKKAELKLIYDKKISDIENVALRSQMNPHFLFNSLNAIKFLILSHQNKKAANYLNRFAKLIRLILEHSKESLISLSDELVALKLYLEIESTRFDDTFSYDINIQSDVNIDQLLVPPLLLQPFVENAIWHGLLPKKEGEKLLNISVVEEDGNYVFVIEDNGIGRLLSAQKKIKDKRLHQSLGMQITEERIDLYNKSAKGNIHLTIIDLPNNSGTRVEIRYQL